MVVVVVKVDVVLVVIVVVAKNNSFIFCNYGMILLQIEIFILGIASFFFHEYSDRYFTMTVNFHLVLIFIVLHTYYSIHLYDMVNRIRGKYCAKMTFVKCIHTHTYGTTEHAEWTSASHGDSKLSF